MTKRKPVLVLTIITAVLFLLAGLFFLISTVFAPASETVAVSFAELNAGIASLFTGGSVGFLVAVIIEAVIFILIPLIVHLVRKQHSVTIILLIGSLLALYISLFSLGYIATPKIFAYLKAIIDGKDEAALEKFVKDLGIFFVLSFPLLAAGSLVELATFIVDMCISAKPKEVATAQSAREEAPVEEEPAPAPVEEPKEEEPAPAPAPVEEVKEEEILEPEPEPEVVEEPKQEPQQEPQQTVININVVGVQPAEQPKAEEEKEEKPAPKKAPAKKAAPKKEEKKPAKKEEKKPEPKKASRETQTIKKPAARETQTIKKAEVLTNDEGKQFVKAYHISQRKELKKWQVKGAGSEKAIKLFDTQKEAIDYANELAAKNGAAVRVHSRAGKMRKA